MVEALSAMVQARTTPEGRRWLADALTAIAAHRDTATLLKAYTAAPRRVGRAPLDASDEELRVLRAAIPELSPVQWTIDDAARAALLLAAAAAEPDASRVQEIAVACYEAGDAREQQSWLRALALLPDAARFRTQAIDACRTNIVPLFEAIACENPYPASYFPEPNFNQLVLKALFNGVALRRIIGLDRRLNPELARMASDYASERRAAGRPVPADIHLCELRS